MSTVDPSNARNAWRFVAGLLLGALLGVLAGWVVDVARPRWRSPTMVEEAAAAAERGAAHTVVDDRNLQIQQRCRGACDKVRS